MKEKIVELIENLKLLYHIVDKELVTHSFIISTRNSLDNLHADFPVSQAELINRKILLEKSSEKEYDKLGAEIFELMQKFLESYEAFIIVRELE